MEWLPREWLLLLLPLTGSSGGTGDGAQPDLTEYSPWKGQGSLPSLGAPGHGGVPSLQRGKAAGVFSFAEW